MSVAFGAWQLYISLLTRRSIAGTRDPQHRASTAAPAQKKKNARPAPRRRDWGGRPPGTLRRAAPALQRPAVFKPRRCPFACPPISLSPLVLRASRPRRAPAVARKKAGGAATGAGASSARAAPAAAAATTAASAWQPGACSLDAAEGVSGCLRVPVAPCCRCCSR